MKALTIQNKAYIAGVVDGEGTISIQRVSRNEGRNPNYSIHTCVTNTSMELLSWLKTTTGIGRIGPPRIKTGRKNCHVWNLSAEEIPVFLSEVVAYLIVRQQHARLMLEFIRGIRHVSQHNPLTVDESILKDLIFRDLQELNKRGV